MGNSIDMQIREQLMSYLVGEISLWDFQRWFMPIEWDLNDDVNPETTEFAHEIALQLAEYLNRHWTEEGLKEKFRSLIQPYLQVVTPVYTTGSSSSLESVLVNISFPNLVLSQ